MYYDFYVTSFSSIEDAPNPQRYSIMKFGSDSAAKEIGYEMADELFKRHSDLLLANDVVVIPSPYNYVKNAATVITEHMIDKLNDLLVNANGSHVEYSIIHRKVSYISDYGFLPKDKREQLLSNDKFYINRDFLKGKLLVFVDDIKITGTHEEKLKEILAKENMENAAIFAYSAKYYGSEPEIEAQLNFAAIDTITDYVKMTKLDSYHILVRPIKFLLKQKSDDFWWFMRDMPLPYLKKLYYSCIGEGYTKIPEYQSNIQTLKRFIDE